MSTKEPPQDPSHYALSRDKDKVVEPLSSSQDPNLAVELIRKKLDDLYATEPAAKTEMNDLSHGVKPQSKHQQFMYNLSTSGKSLAEIQTQWHAYYADLSDQEKHEVWQEFYKQHAQASHGTAAAVPATPQPTTHVPVETTLPPHRRPKAAADSRSVQDLKHQLKKRLQTRGQKQRSHQFKSLGFGLSMGSVVVVIFMFGFFNERFIAPFITPSRSVSDTPIIVDPNGTATGPGPKIIIPKINVEIPVVYDETSIEEAAVQKALERGVIHYATTTSPGETGHGVIFGHSSNNILNRGKYKFAFVLLRRLETGDTFILEKDGKRYIYRVFDKKVVPPTDVSVLGGNEKPASFSLITCDPPGTSTNRLVVTGEQISPDPVQNIASSAKPNEAAKPEILPSNSPSLWQRFVNWLTS